MATGTFAAAVPTLIVVAFVLAASGTAVPPIHSLLAAVLLSALPFLLPLLPIGVVLIIWGYSSRVRAVDGTE